MASENSAIAIKIFSAIIAFISGLIAFFLYRIQKRQPWAQALYNIMSRLETKTMRNIRRNYIYCFPRDSEDPIKTLSETLNKDPELIKKDIDRWGAEMDMLALLYFSNQLDRTGFFEMYGDVLIRSAYQLAPYANKMRKENRGDQFWLPFQRLTIEILKMWCRLSMGKKYPKSIMIPCGDYNITITLDTLIRDAEAQSFLKANNLKMKFNILKILVRFKLC